MGIFDGILILLAVLGLTIIFVHSTIMDKIGLRPFWERAKFFKELFDCSMCCSFWFAGYGIFCAYLKIQLDSFWFYVLTLPFACSAFSYMIERFVILADEKINQILKKNE